MTTHTLKNTQPATTASFNNPKLAATVLRLSLGVMFLAHGWLKASVFTFAGTAGFFASLGLPGWMAYPVIIAEIGGGLLLIAGVRARWVAAALIPVLAGALWVHVGNGWLFSNANGGWEFPLFLITASVAQFLLGDGRFALLPERR